MWLLLKNPITNVMIYKEAKRRAARLFSRSFKVVDFGTSQNLVCNFLLVIIATWSYLAPFQRYCGFSAEYRKFAGIAIGVDYTT